MWKPGLEKFCIIIQWSVRYLGWKDLSTLISCKDDLRETAGLREGKKGLDSGDRSCSTGGADAKELGVEWCLVLRGLYCISI
jgi:hypothetical protein